VTGRARVLMVDDDELVLTTLRDNLEHLGFKVTAFTEPQEALEAFHQAPGAFDLLLTDYQMPGLNGPRLADALWAIRPDLPAILLSGDPSSRDGDAPGLGRFQALLSKPIMAKDLARKILAVLTAAGSASVAAP